MPPPVLRDATQIHVGPPVTGFVMCVDEVLRHQTCVVVSQHVPNVNASELHEIPSV